MQPRTSHELPDLLHAALRSLGARRPDLVLDIQWHAALPSTMDTVAEAAAAGAQAGLVVIADSQTAGRGRRGHSWSSPPGAGIYFSYLARPRRHVGLITLAAGVGVRAGIGAATGVHADLKWPNDLLIGSRKLAGLLAEGSHLATPDAVVTIGVGVNVHAASYPPEVAARATSLDVERGRSVSREEVCVAIIEHLADTLRSLEAGGADDILRQWREAAPTASGTAVTWTDRGVEHHGVTAGIDDTGALLVATSAGLSRVISGELTWHFQ